MLIKVKNITRFFNQSTKQTSKLRDALKAKNKTYSSLIQSVSTRWNSMYFMLERFYSCLDEVNSVLCRVKHNLDTLTPEEISIIPDILVLLKPFADLNEPLSGETKPTISLIIPAVKSLQEELHEIKTELKTEEGRELQQQLVQLTKKYLSPYEEIDFCRYDLNSGAEK